MIVPANMTRFYQPLDFTINGYANKFVKNSWYTSQVTKQFDEEVKLDEVNVKLLLSTMVKHPS